MPRYDWYNRFYIESKKATYTVYHKGSGQPIYDGKADDAYTRLVKGSHPYFREETFVNVIYYHGNTATSTLRYDEAERIANAKLPRKNRQLNTRQIRLCKHPSCRRTVMYPDKYCWQHSY